MTLSVSYLPQLQVNPNDTYDIATGFIDIRDPSNGKIISTTSQEGVRFF